jgi:hypothetical protein
MKYTQEKYAKNILNAIIYHDPPANPNAHTFSVLNKYPYFPCISGQHSIHVAMAHTVPPNAICVFKKCIGNHILYGAWLTLL